MAVANPEILRISDLMHLSNFRRHCLLLVPPRCAADSPFQHTVHVARCRYICSDLQRVHKLTLQ